MQPCSSPPAVTDGFFVIAKGSYSNGDQISYYCKMGYELTGTATRSCDGATGAWSGSTPKCTAATTIASVTTTTESPSQITVAALVLVPMVILLLVLVSAVTVYAMKYLHCQNGCKKQTFWFDGEEYVQYGRWYSCCNSCLINCYELCTCQNCQKVRPSGNRKADVWRSTNGGPWMPENAKMSTPSKMFSSSVWSSSVESRNGEHWRPTLGSLHETSQTTLSDI